MSSNFKLGHMCCLAFYVIESLVVLIMSLVMQRLELWGILIFVAVTIGLIALLKRGKNNKVKLGEEVHKKVQAIAFVFVNTMLSWTFDSAQTFLFATCFSSVLCFIFLDGNFAKYQMYLSLISTLAMSMIVGFYTQSTHTMTVFCFGTVVIIVINWIIMIMAKAITFQNRKSFEQERSLDDLLKVVEAKCDDAQTATRSKTRFLAHVSHEIRTPINSIMGMNELIIRETSEEEIREYAIETKVAAESLLGIINDILDISRIEAGKVRFCRVKFNLPKIIGDVYNLIKFRAQTKDLDFIITADRKIPTVVMGDDIRLKQIITNLLTNAVKYTNKGSITLDLKMLSEDEIRISVKDTGIGIKEEDLQRVFSAFDRLEETRNRSVEGTGLGLNITTELLEMMGSKLEVNSVYGEGSEFYFVLKLDIVDPTPMGELKLNDRVIRSEEYNASFEAPDAHVLVVDDNDINRSVFTKLLKHTKIKITEAENGEDCLLKTQNTHFDVIFMDHMMPVMDGTEAFKRLRKQENGKCRNTPVVMLTANAVIGAKTEYSNMGFNGFLTKPIDYKKLEEMLYSLLDAKLVKSAPPKTRHSKNEPVETIEFPEIPGVDWSYARMHIADDELILETVKLFCAAAKSHLNELDLYVDSIDSESSLDSYRIKVHGMKSSAAIIGIVPLAGMAAELENCAKSADTEAIKAMHPIFARRWLSLSGALQQSLFESDEPKQNAADHVAEIEEIFAQIRSGAEEMDIDILDEMAKKLDEYSFDGAEAEKIDEIKQAILNFEIESLMTCTSPFSPAQ